MASLRATLSYLLFSAAITGASPINQGRQAGIIPFSKRMTTGFDFEDMRIEQRRLKRKYAAIRSTSLSRRAVEGAHIEAIPPFDIHERREARRQLSSVEGLNNVEDNGQYKRFILKL